MIYQQPVRYEYHLIAPPALLIVGQRPPCPGGAVGQMPMASLGRAALLEPGISVGVAAGSATYHWLECSEAAVKAA